MCDDSLLRCGAATTALARIQYARSMAMFRAMLRRYSKRCVAGTRREFLPAEIAVAVGVDAVEALAHAALHAGLVAADLAIVVAIERVEHDFTSLRAAHRQILRAVAAHGASDAAASSDVAHVFMTMAFMTLPSLAETRQRKAQFRAICVRWLSATPPRISAPAIAIVSVSGSPSTIHAHTTPNSGTRYVTVTARGAPMR